VIALIELSRALARQLRTVLRRTLLDQETRTAWPPLLFRSTANGLTVSASLGDIAVAYRHAAPGSPAVLAFPASVLAQSEARTDTPVLLGPVTERAGQARWLDTGTPRTVEFETVAPDSLPPLPPLPKKLVAMPDDFLRGLGAAVQTTARASTRCAWTRLQLCGPSGQLIATDGRQLLIQSGFTFPWQGTILVPRLSLFGRRGAPVSGPVALGRTQTHLVLTVGDWAFWLTLDTTSRFPKVEGVLPRATAAARLQLDPADAALLMTTLPKLPGLDADHAPVTLDLSTPPAVRAQPQQGGPATEIALTRSAVSGRGVRVVTDRHFLLRAIQLGFREVQVVQPNAPLLCRDPQRTYVWMPLDPQSALPPAQDRRRRSSAATTTPSPAQPQPEPRRTGMPAPTGNGHVPEDHASSTAPDRSGGLNDLIAEVESLRNLLGDAASRAHRLLAALKQHRRQAKAVQAAVTSLRQLRLGG
jgi:hypothetical protein